MTSLQVVAGVGMRARLAPLSAAIDECLLADQAPLRRRLAGLADGRRRDRRRGGSLEQAMARLGADIDRSRTVRSARARLAPALVFPAELPFSAHVEAIGARLERHQVLIVSGETGCGKSTQLPKLCLRHGRGIAGRIGHTQPRRIAARAIAARLAQETATAAGELVGHCVRFDDNLGPATRVKVMTDGILLNEIHRDPWLLQYDTLIIDEVHERSLNIDFLIGYLQRVLARRPELKLILTSATMDTGRFERVFEDAATYTIAGRSYPVEVRHRPPEAAEKGEEPDVGAAIVAAVHELDAEQRGDILVFLPGEREIREAAARLRKAGLDDTEILSLYARLGDLRQARIFRPGAARRIVLATNIAETSLTVPRVRHVIDSGQARVSRYSPRRKLQQLRVEKIARANAAQRAGRCGREAAGVCIRLYGEDDFAARRAVIEPEIQRTHLAGVILRLKALGIADVEHFPFAEAPATRLIKDGYAVLQEIGALDGARELTALGARLVRFPLDPRLSRVLTSAAELGCLAECLVIVAALSIADPRERPHELRDAADRAHAAFADKRSDFMWFVRAWPFARALQRMPAGRRGRLCRRHFLSGARMREWVELHDHLRKLALDAGLALNAEAASYRAVQTALAAGFPSHIGAWQGDHYLGCRNGSFRLHPASALARHEPKWVVAAEIVETREPYARIAGRLEPQWLEQVAAHLIKRAYEAPYWDGRRGCVRATEIQRLYGLVINPGRLVDYARIDHAAARDIFLEHALVDGELGAEPPFLAHNLALVARIQELEARARRRDLLAPRSQLRAFYAERLPPAVCTRRALMDWLRADPAHGLSLCMDEAHATTAELASVSAFLFPDHLDIGGSACPLGYRFEPGHPADGVTVSVPLALLPRLRPAHIDRLVPGMLSEKVEALLRGLPKAWRRRLSPLREYTMAAVEALEERTGPLEMALSAALSAMIGSELPATLFDASALAPHLRCNIAVVDDGGSVVAEGRDLGPLWQACGEAALADRAALAWGLAGRSNGEWSFGALPARIELDRGGIRIAGYPAVHDAADAVEVAVVDDAETAARTHAEGIARLLALNATRRLKSLARHLPRAPALALLAASFGHRRDPLAAILEAAARRRCHAVELPRTAAEFACLLAELEADMRRTVNAQACAWLELLERAAALRSRLGGETAPGAAAARDDILVQLETLFGPATLDYLLSERGLERAPRYLDAIARRLERMESNPGKDLRKLERLAPLWARYLDARRAGLPAAAAAGALHFMFEEYRIATFAPELGVADKVTERHIEAALAGLAVEHRCGDGDTLVAADGRPRRSATTLGLK